MLGKLPNISLFTRIKYYNVVINIYGARKP